MIEIFVDWGKKLLYDGVMSYVVMNLRVVFELVIVMFFIKIKKKNYMKIFVEGLNIIFVKFLDYYWYGVYVVF